MGIYDEIRCEYPLPLKGINEVRFSNEGCFFTSSRALRDARWGHTLAPKLRGRGPPRPKGQRSGRTM